MRNRWVGQGTPPPGGPPSHSARERATVRLGVRATHVLGGAEELRAGIAGEHADDDHLAPLLHVDEQVTELPVVLVDQVDALRAHLLEGHHHAARHQLGSPHRQERINRGRKGLGLAPITHLCASIYTPWSCQPEASR